jgi:chromosome segregation ATPase
VNNSREESMDLDQRIEKMREEVITSNNINVADRDSEQFKIIVNDIIAEKEKYSKVKIPKATRIGSKLFKIPRKIKSIILGIPILGRVIRRIYYILIGNTRKIFEILSRIDDVELSVRDNNVRMDNISDRLELINEKYDDYSEQMRVLMSEVNKLKAENEELKKKLEDIRSSN